MEKLTRRFLLEILSEKWAWDVGTPKKPKEPELKYRAIREAIENRKGNLYYDKILFPQYHRYLRLLKVFIDDENYIDLHFEEIDGKLWFGSDCPECQSKIDLSLDRVLYRYCQAHPEWIQEYPTDEEIDELVTTKPTHQTSMF